MMRKLPPFRDSKLQKLCFRYCSFYPDDSGNADGIPPVILQPGRDSLSPSSARNNSNMWIEKPNTAGETKHAPVLNKGVTSDEEEYDGDYSSKWEYLGKGIWENQVPE